MLTWDKPDERYYEHGLDRGVLYPPTIPPAPVVFTNHARNPRFEAGNVPAWTGGPVPMTFVDPGLETEGKGLRWTTTSTAGLHVRISSGIAVSPNQVWTVAVRVRNHLGGRTLKSRVRYVDAAGASVGFTDSVGSIGTPDGPFFWQWSSMKAPANAVELEPGFAASTVGLVGDSFDIDAIMVYPGSEPPPKFFDGATQPDRYLYEWLGVPHASASVKKEIIGTAIPWNGLQGFDEGTEAGQTSLLYRDGIIYMADSDASDFSGKLSAIFWPDEFAECVGIPQVADGLFADNQKPKKFDFSYRTLVGSGGVDDRFGYQIHLVYNAMPSISTRARRTLGSDNTPTTFDFDLVCTPVKLAGYRPTAHFIVDTRNMSASVIAQVEGILYGDDTQPARMPTPTELYELMNFGEAMIFNVHTNGTYTVSGSSDNLFSLDDYHFQMKNINAVDNGDGTYLVSDGGTTDVIIE